MKISELRAYRESIYALGDAQAETQQGFGQREDGLYTIDRGLSDYLEDLPLIPAEFFDAPNQKEQNVLEYLKISLRKKLERSDPTPLTVVDIGCGRGQFLIEVAEYLLEHVLHGDTERFLRSVRLCGISIADLRSSNTWDKNLPPTTDTLERYGIDYVVGDMRNLPQCIGRAGLDKVDCFVSDIAICYVEPARMTKEILRQTYRLLRPGGVAALSYVGLLRAPDEYPFLSLSEDLQVISHFLNSYGSDNLRIDLNKSTNGDVIMRKTDAPFILPVVYTRDGRETLGAREWAAEPQHEYMPNLNKSTIARFQGTYYTALYALMIHEGVDPRRIEYMREAASMDSVCELPQYFEPRIWSNIKRTLTSYGAVVTPETLERIERIIAKCFAFTRE